METSHVSGNLNNALVNGSISGGFSQGNKITLSTADYPLEESKLDSNVLLFRNPTGNGPSSNSPILPSIDNGSALLPSNMAEQNDLGLMSDLDKLGLPKHDSDRGHDQNFNSAYSKHTEVPQSGPLLPEVRYQDEEVERYDSYTEKGYNSDTTGLSQERYQESLPQSDVLHTGSTSAGLNHLILGYLQNKLTEDSSDRLSFHEIPNAKKRNNSGSNKRENERDNIDTSNYSENLAGSHLSYFAPFHEADSNEGISEKTRTAGQSARANSKPRSLKFVRPNSRTGVLSDDEYIINASSSNHYHGRRSAPIFTKRGFIASEFWTSGQTSIERARMQDKANARNQGTLKSPHTNTFMKLPGKKQTLSPQVSRSRSVDPSLFFNKTKYDQIKKEPVEAATLPQGKEKSFVKTYGSTDNTKTVVDHRGYHSERETWGRRTESNNSERKGQLSSVNDWLRSSQSLTWSADDAKYSVMQDGTKFEKPADNASETVRTQSMKGIFRPFTGTPRDLQSKVTRVKDTIAKKSGVPDYIIENYVTDSQQQPFSSSESSDESSQDEHDVGKEEELSSVEKSIEKSGIKPEVRTEVYSRRWYLLALFSVSAMLWNAIWSTWGPIAQSAKAVYGWNDGDISMFTYLGNIPFLITMFPCAYMMDVKGMRMAMIFSCVCMFLGTGFRCLPGNAATMTWFIRIGQTLNGIAGTIPTSGPALLSGLWFPPSQRATATAISTVAGYMGTSVSFVIGPLLVPEPGNLSPINDTFEFNLLSDIFDASNSSNTTDNGYSAQEKGIRSILYGEFAVAGLLVLLVLVYFPSKPPLPPSISASIPREKYLNGLKLLVKNKQFWVCAIAFSVPIGVYESWQVILDVNLEPRGISQQIAGWLDFYAVVGGCVSGLLVSRFADFFTRQMKLFLLVFYFFATVAVLWFTLVVFDIMPFDQVSIYAAVIIAGVFLDGGTPLLFELTVEVSYPVGEGVTSGFTHMLCAAAGSIFLIVVQIQSLGKQWMNWCFLGCVAVTLPLLFFVNTTYSRADIDDMEIDISEDEEAMTGIEAADTNEKTSLLKNSNL